ncbi:MAG: type II secretion system protein [Candidatus Omnitrophota bacterium]
MYRKARSGDSFLGNRAFTLGELLVVAAIFAVMMIALAPFARMIKERSHNISCADNLRRISLGLHMYAADNNDVLPPKLEALYPNYVKDEKAFDCPASKRTGTPDKPDYEYNAGLTEAASQSEVAAYDADGNHKNRGRNVLRMNGMVEWVRKGEGKPR